MKVIQSGYQLSELAEPTAQIADDVQQSTTSIAGCYGYAEATTMTGVCYKMWKLKTARADIVSTPKLMYRPPTNEAFRLNMMRAHLQTCVWKHATQTTQPAIDPLQCG